MQRETTKERVVGIQHLLLELLLALIPKMMQSIMVSNFKVQNFNGTFHCFLLDRD